MTLPSATETSLTDIVGKKYIVKEGRDFRVFPGSASEVAELVNLARRDNCIIVPVGRERRRTERSTVDTDQRIRFLLCTERMNHVLHLEESALYVHVQAGMSGLELEEILQKRGLTLGDFPPTALASSIGGLLSVRTPGKSSRRHGTFEDTVLGVSAVLANGETVHTRIAPRRASGPDLARALCGSEGTLGILTAAVLRIHKEPESRLLAAYRLPSFSDALTAVRLSLREEASPVALRIYDTQEAHAHFGDVCTAPECILVAATAGPTSLAACDRDLISSAVEVVGGTEADDELASTWWNRRTHHRDASATMAKINLQASATPRKLASVYDATCEAVAAEDLAVQAHGACFDRDGGVLFFSILDNDSLLPADDPRLAQVGRAAESAGAYLLGATNTALRSHFQALRDIIDPHRHLNPDVLA